MQEGGEGLFVACHLRTARRAEEGWWSAGEIASKGLSAEASLMIAVLPNTIAKHQDFVSETRDLVVLAEDEFLLHAMLCFQESVGF
jgi:hypothetical protein